MQMCDNCGKNPANIHLTQIVNNETTMFHFCEECAEKKGISISLGDAVPAVKVPEKIEKDVECPNCKMKLSEFKAKGWLGCAECYNAFFDEIEQLFKQVHGASTHKGKMYTRRMVTKKRVSIKQLRAELDTAIKSEQFELAAELRDAINSLTAKSETKTQ
jgi:protein arginine kinase activator